MSSKNIDFRITLHYKSSFEIKDIKKAGRKTGSSFTSLVLPKCRMRLIRTDSRKLLYRFSV